MSTKGKSQLEPLRNTDSNGTKKKQEVQYYRWAFTLRYIMEDGEPVEPRVVYDNLKNFCKEFYYQLEQGEEDGYLHFQGCFSLVHKERLKVVKHIVGDNAVHLEHARNWAACKQYSKKNETRVKGPWSHNTVWIDVIKELNFWQQELYNTLMCKPDPRIIYWFYDSRGNKGKSAFSKYCGIMLNAVICNNGGFSDIAYSIPDNPNIVIFDLPRTIEGRVNYSAIEKCKDGAIFSAKYESRMKFFNPPHVVIFANFYPDTSAMSSDRWVIMNLDEVY